MLQQLGSALEPPVKDGRAELLLLGKKRSRPTELLELAPPSRSELIP